MPVESTAAFETVKSEYFKNPTDSSRIHANTLLLTTHKNRNKPPEQTYPLQDKWRSVGALVVCSSDRSFSSTDARDILSAPAPTPVDERSSFGSASASASTPVAAGALSVYHTSAPIWWYVQLVNGRGGIGS